MEPAKIDWKRIESRFVEDSVYEHINAPKWVDFLAPQDPIDDEAWFCKPDCNHPKAAEDFFITPPTSKLPSSVDIREILPLQDQNQRDAQMRRRGTSQSSSVSNDCTTKINEDGENQNPNFSTPVNYQSKSMKAAIKSSSEKKTADENWHNEEVPRLKTTLSARNLFAGRDILGHITEFCNELKKLATRARERENEEKLNEKKKSQVGEKNEIVVKKASSDVLDELDGKEKERKPLLEVGREKCEGLEKQSGKEKQRRKKRFDDAENVPISLNIENVQHKGEERLMQIRVNPPSPQCFSVTRAPLKTTPPKASRSRPMERGILQEVGQNKEVIEEPANKSRSVSVVNGREARGLDVFWFLKPCTLAG